MARDAEQTREDMLLIHSLNLNLLPPVESGKTLWHVIPIDRIPLSIRGDFVYMVNYLNRAYPDVREKIKVVTERQDLNDAITGLLNDKNNIVDVAVSCKEDLENIPKGVKALVFDGKLGDFRQLEGILAALRALQQENARALINLYEILTGQVFKGSEADIIKYMENPKRLAGIIIFNLKPIEIHTYKDLEELNRTLLAFIRAA